MEWTGLNELREKISKLEEENKAAEELLRKL